MKVLCYLLIIILEQLHRDSQYQLCEVKVQVGQPGMDVHSDQCTVGHAVVLLH